MDMEVSLGHPKYNLLAILSLNYLLDSIARTKMNFKSLVLNFEPKHKLNFTFVGMCIKIKFGEYLRLTRGVEYGDNNKF